MACETIYGGLGETIAAIAAGNQTSVPEKLADAVEVYLRECLKNRDQILLMYREYRHLPREAHQRYKDREQEIVTAFVGLIESGVQQRMFRQVNAVVLAHDIVLLGHLPALKGWSVGTTLTPQVVLTEQVELVMSRLRASEP
jgi:TetR/AcrR family transcriptional regulator, cholesterol catabolism regulator